MVETPTGSHLVLLGNWNMLPGTSTYHGGVQSDVILTVDPTGERPEVHWLPLHQILNSYFKPTRVRDEKAEEWSEVPFAHDCPLRYLITNATVEARGTKVSWTIQFRCGWQLDIVGTLGPAKTIVLVSGGLSHGSVPVRANANQPPVDHSPNLTTEHSAVWPNPRNVPGTWRFFSVWARDVSFVVTQVSIPTSDGAYLVTKDVARNDETTSVCNIQTSDKENPVYLWSVIDQDLQIERVLVSLRSPSAVATGQAVNVKIDLGSTTTFAVIEQEDGENAHRVLDVADRDKASILALLNTGDLDTDNWIPATFQRDTGNTGNTIRTGVLFLDHSNKALDSWWKKAFVTEFMATPTAIGPLSNRQNTTAQLDNIKWAGGSNRPQDEEKKAAFQSFLRMLLMQVYVDIFRVARGTNCNISLYVSKPGRSDNRWCTAYETNWTACAKEFSNVTGVSMPLIKYLNESIVPIKGAMAAVQQDLGEYGSKYGLLCADLGGGTLDISGSLVNNNKPAPKFHASFDFGADNCFYLPQLGFNNDTVPRNRIGITAAKEFSRILSGELSREYYSGGQTVAQALVPYHAILTHIVLTYAQSLRSQLFDNDDEKYLPVYVVLSGGGWLWFPQLQNYPNNPRLLDYEKLDDSPTPVFARPYNANSFANVDSECEDQTTRNAAKYFKKVAKAVSLNKVAYMLKSDMLKAADVTHTAAAKTVAYPVGLTMWKGLEPQKFDPWWFDQVAPPEEADDDEGEKPPTPSQTSGGGALTASHASLANKGSEYGICVSSGPWTHLPSSHQCYDCVLPKRYAARPQSEQFTGVSPEGMGKLIAAWGKWAKGGKNPDSFLVFLSEQICYALRDRIV